MHHHALDINLWDLSHKIRSTSLPDCQVDPPERLHVSGDLTEKLHDPRFSIAGSFIE
jgi:hypothetical protein